MPWLAHNGLNIGSRTAEAYRTRLLFRDARRHEHVLVHMTLRLGQSNRHANCKHRYRESLQHHLYLPSLPYRWHDAVASNSLLPSQFRSMRRLAFAALPPNRFVAKQKPQDTPTRPHPGASAIFIEPRNGVPDRVVVSKGQMAQHSKLWHEFLDVAEGFGIATLGLTLLVVLVAVAALILHFAS